MTNGQSEQKQRSQKGRRERWRSLEKKKKSMIPWALASKTDRPLTFFPSTDAVSSGRDHYGSEPSGLYEEKRGGLVDS